MAVFRFRSNHRGTARTFLVRRAAVFLLAVSVPAAVLLVPSPATADVESPVARKEIRALHINPHSPRIDGKLNDPAWANALFVSDFIQKLPNEGEPPTERTEVAIIYDDHAIYVGARMFSADTKHLRTHLDRRDRHGPAEQFIVTIDSYLDRRTAYGFGVNTAGVRIDRYNPEDNEYNRDYTYDPVWEARTHVGDDSWTLEMKIPFSQLRFNDKPEQVWGINFNRWVPERNEDIFWVHIPSDETAWASRFGNLVGIKGVKPSRRLEFLPYTASNASSPTDEGLFSSATQRDSRFGGDLKMGLGPNMTLDATFNPDFGQVEADPAEVNLSAFETFFSERRPFFLEGSQLLRGSGPNYYYSRRIGGATRILTASKVTGQLANGTSLGAMAAATERNLDISEPFSLYGVGRLQKQFGKNQSTAGISLTGVYRDLSQTQDLKDNHRKGAVTGGADWNLRFSDGTYRLAGYAGFSHIQGSETVILRAQQSSARYFQRPDANYISIDSSRTSLSGYTTGLILQKRSGKHWLWYTEASLESPGFELNDAGRLSSADDKNVFANLVYRNTQPGSWYQNYSLETYSSGNWNYGNERQYSEIGFSGNVTFQNFWNSNVFLNRQFSGQNDGATRGGPTMRRESGYSMGGGLSNGFAQTTQMGLNLTYGVDDLDGWLYRIRGDFTTRIGNRLQVSAFPAYQKEDQPRQYVATIDSAGGGINTFGSRYIFSRIAQTTISLQLRMNYFFTPDLSLEVYAEPFAAQGRFYDHGELLAAGTNELRVYHPDSITTTTEKNLIVSDNGASFTIPYRDFNFVSFRSNMVLRYEFRPGSTLFLVWQRNVSGSRSDDTPLNFGSLTDALSASGNDFFAFKIAYWLPIS